MISMDSINKALASRGSALTQADLTVWYERVVAAQAAVGLERVAQLEKWGLQDHDLTTWLTILGEEYGELCKRVNAARFDNDGEDITATQAEAIKHEAKQVAAVAQAIMQVCDWDEA